MSVLLSLGLEGSTVIVVGAGGLGAACVRGFIDAGAKVVAIDKDSETLNALASALTPELFTPVRGDLANRASCDAAMEEALAVLGGRLDVVVHALGINSRKPFLEYNDEEWRKIMHVNLDTAFWVAQFAGQHLQLSQGRLLFFSSVAGTLGHKSHAPYAASKGGINQLTKVLAHEWAASGVCVNAIAPGYIETELTREHLELPGIREGLTDLVPAGRLGTPEEVVGPVLFLASQLASFVTGEILHVDGGRTLV